MELSVPRQYALTNVIARLESAWIPPVVKGLDFKGEFNPPIPFPLPKFMEAETTVSYFLKGSKRRFLDIGSGIGTKLLLMRELQWDVTGIERIPELVDASVKLLGNNCVFQGDARKLNDSQWEQYDFIYSYRPFKDDLELQALWQKLVACTPVGTVLYLPDSPAVDGLDKIGMDLYVNVRNT